MERTGRDRHPVVPLLRKSRRAVSYPKHIKARARLNIKAWITMVTATQTAIKKLNRTVTDKDCLI